jgi:DNA/RNA-binding domain of Phe-tRNA-synthetase-like protein
MSREHALPDGRFVRLGDALNTILVAGLGVIEGITVGPPDSVRPAIESLATELRERYSGRLPSEIPPLQEARTLYKSVGIQPTRTRPSSEALLRRVLKGGDLYAISNAVDVCNLASLEFLLPLGLYDLAKISGDATLRLGREGEAYPGIRKGEVHLAGRLGLFDDEGPFGSPTSDSLRTCVDEGTKDLLVVIMATADYDLTALRAHVDRFVELTVTHCGGRGFCAGLLHANSGSQ